MGTDIHMYVEKFTLHEQPGTRFDMVARETFAEAPLKPTEWRLVIDERGEDSWSDRNYATFAVLANVRNGYGFAGVPTHAPVVPIATPRGLPSDVGSWIDDVELEHSMTWLLLSEVLAYDWGQEISRTGVMPLSETDRHNNDGDSLEKMLKEGRTAPTYWCGSISGPKITTVDNATGRRMLGGEQSARRISDVKYYVHVSWTIKLDEVCASFLAWARGLTRLGAPDQVRLVFFFDS